MSMKKHRARQFKQGGEADTHLDTDDQKHLRDVVLEEIEQVMRKHKCGGVVLINSFESAAWRWVLPEWGGLVQESDTSIRVRFNTRSPDARARADATLGFVRSMQMFSLQIYKRFSDIWEHVSEELGPGGVYEVTDYSMAGKPKPPENQLVMTERANGLARHPAHAHVL